MIGHGQSAVMTALPMRRPTGQSVPDAHKPAQAIKNANAIGPKRSSDWSKTTSIEPISHIGTAVQKLYRSNQNPFYP